MPFALHGCVARRSGRFAATAIKRAASESPGRATGPRGPLLLTVAVSHAACRNEDGCKLYVAWLRSIAYCTPQGLHLDEPAEPLGAAAGLAALDLQYHLEPLQTTKQWRRLT